MNQYRPNKFNLKKKNRLFTLEYGVYPAFGAG